MTFIANYKISPFKALSKWDNSIQNVENPPSLEDLRFEIGCCHTEILFEDLIEVLIVRETGGIGGFINEHAGIFNQLIDRHANTVTIA